MKIKKIVQLIALSATTIVLAEVNPVYYLCQKQIVNGFTMSNPGTYVLTDDATITGALNITGTNVIFDMNGKTITDNTGVTVFSLTGKNITVQNGTISGMAPNGGTTIGVLITHGPVASINGIDFINCFYGVNVSGVTGATEVTIRNCTADSCENAFYLNSDTEARIEACSVDSCANGFTFASSTKAWVNNCVANFGITGFFVNASSSVVVQNCKAYMNSSVNFQSDASYSSALFLGNIAFNATDAGNYAGMNVPPFYSITNTSFPVGTSTFDQGLVNYSIIS